MVMNSNTIAELEAQLGEHIKTLRLIQNIDQMTLAQRAGISVGTMKNLENGAGSTLRTLIAVLRILGRTEWLSTIAPIPSINPLSIPRATQRRQRASRKPKSQPGTAQQ